MGKRKRSAAPPANYLPMPLHNVQVGDYWPFRGKLKRADGGPPVKYPPEWERMLVGIVQVGPGFVVERVRLSKFEWWTGMEAHRLALKPPGRGWKRVEDAFPWWSWWVLWERRRTWEAE